MSDALTFEDDVRLDEQWHQRLARLAEEAPEDQARALAALESELERTTEAAVAEGPAGVDLLQLVTEAQQWRDACARHALSDEAQRAAALTSTLLERVATQWEQEALTATAETSPTACFDRLEQTVRLQLLATQEQPDTDRGRSARLFEPTVRALRQRLSDMPASELQDSRRQHWAKALTDLANEVLGEIDELEPAAAAARLNVVRDALDWHLTFIETQRGARRRRLRRKLKRVRAEAQERALQGRLEQRFGRSTVAFSERAILLLIGLVLVLLTLEFSFEWSRSTLLVFHLLDTFACACFIGEFAIKLWHTDERAFWFRRHWLVDLLPAVPVGLLSTGLAGLVEADAIRAGRAARLFRLPRLLRYLRLLRPLVHFVRAMGLLVRGLDRLVPRYAGLLNRHIILHPTVAELRASTPHADTERDTTSQPRAALRQRWREVLAEAPQGSRPAIARQRLGMLDEAARHAVLRLEGEPVRSNADRRQALARPLLERLAALEAAEVAGVLDADQARQLARVIRLLARPPARWLMLWPFLPPLSAEMDDAQCIAAAARRSGSTLKRWHDMGLGLADLYGTVTPSQFVDRLGTMLVNSSFRPAYRLVMFGGALVLVQVGLMFTAVEALEPLEHLLRDFLGPTILVLGSLALLALGVGWWMKQLAREATEFYERAAEANHISLTEVLRKRHLERDAAIVGERVFEAAPPSPAATAPRSRNQADELVRRVRSLMSTGGGDAPHAAAAEPMDRLVLLLRDWLDGAMFTRADTRATGQLLGNPAINQLIHNAGRIDRAEQKGLRRLDLRRQGTVLGTGPYLWFNFISQACLHSVAILLVEYNRYAIPLDALERYSSNQRRDYERWLNRDTDVEPPTGAVADGSEHGYVTTAFTALHFLDDDPQRDAKIRARFGDAVLQRMQADRRLLIRRIFGTYPMHELPQEQRILNPYTLYQRWLAGGRAVLLPITSLTLVGRGLRWLARWTVHSVQEIRHTALRRSRANAAVAGFHVAARKIDRMRLPVVLASLRLRATVDPEYLGTRLHRSEESADTSAPIDLDRTFLALGVSAGRFIEAQKQRARADMRRLRGLIADGLLEEAAGRIGLPTDALRGPERERAAAVAYLADYRGVRSRLSAHAVIIEAGRHVASSALPAGRGRPRPMLKRRFNRFWTEHGEGDQRQRTAAWLAVRDNVWGAADALAAWRTHGEHTQEAGQRRMGELLQHAEQIHEQVLTLRAVQTMTVLDVLHYREHVHRLGGYREENDTGGVLLRWPAPTRRDQRSA